MCCGASSSAEHMLFVDMFTVAKVHHQTSVQKQPFSYEILNVSTWIISAKRFALIFICVY